MAESEIASIRKREKLCLERTFTSLLACASFAAGQVTSGNVGNGSTGFNPQRPVSFEDVKKFLALSDPQMQQLGKILDEQTSASQGTYEKIEAKRAELDELFRSGSRDITRYGQLTLDIYTLSNQTPASVDDWRSRALAVLNPQQRSRLEPLAQAAKLSAAASQAVALNLVDSPPPPVSPLSPMPTLPD